MLFTSYQFVLVFLPVTLLAVLGASRFGQHTLAKLLLFAASIVFYAWWNPRYVALLLALVAFNYALGTWMIDTRDLPTLAARRKGVLVAGVVANVSTLVYFKYTGFIAAELGVSLAPILLPLGISFMVFQKIAFLVDAYGGGIKRLSLLDYAVFVTFFPQLISGPIVHHREVIPQLEQPTSLRYSARITPVAIGFLVIGAFKKVVIADALSPYVAVAFDGAAAGKHLGLLGGWSAALAYLFQVYFDFSGYSDMAIGLGLLFGIRLPFNFNSPLKAASPIDYWNRWHITLTRFLTAYIYNPLAMRATRRRMANKQPIRKNGVMTLGAFARLLALPTLVTFFIAGVWHGAGYQFAVFGLIHGVYLVGNHAWRNLRAPRDDDGGDNANARPSATAIWLCRIAMLAGTAAAVVYFRADSVATGWRFTASMLGAGGLSRPIGDARCFALLALCLAVTQLLPNTQELMRDQLDRVTTPLAKHAGEARDDLRAWSWPRVAWRPTILWAIAMGLAAWYVMLSMAKPTEFLYFQF